MTDLLQLLYLRSCNCFLPEIMQLLPEVLQLLFT
jgi:hypothetical protein